MSQDVLFYVLNSDTHEAREAFVCKLLNKIHKEKRLCDVRFASESEAKRFDLQLWSWKPDSFIPHALNQEIDAPIQLFSETPTTKPTKQDVLINLHPEFPSFFEDYTRTIEVLDQSAYLLQMGRERWKAYRQFNIEPVVYKIGFSANSN